MSEVNSLQLPLGAMVRAGKMAAADGVSPSDWKRIENLAFPDEVLAAFLRVTSKLGVSKDFIKVMQTFRPSEGVIPAGFRPALVLEGDAVCVDLKRDISYAENGEKRPTAALFSADSANPYEVEPLKNFIANLTCNPAIIYNNFIRNTQANIGGKFKDRYEVMEELCRVLGPGVDISVEVDDPFADESALFEEIARFEEILTPYRLCVKIPHTGPVNAGNKQSLIDGNFPHGFEAGTVSDRMYGHNLAHKLWRRGYRVNFTLMFEPHQMALALLARPYFINAFVNRRYQGSKTIQSLLEQNAADKLRAFMRGEDMLSPEEEKQDDGYVTQKARETLAYRRFADEEGADGLDAVRHGLRLLRGANLPDTRLIVCSLAAEESFPALDKLLVSDEFRDMASRVVITAPPAYISRFASAAGVLTYQRIFLDAVARH